MHVNPSLEWYIAESEKRSLPIRCPFAVPGRCPRYFQSLALLGESGITTKISKAEDARLTKLWSNSDLWPTTAEQLTSISGGEDAPYQLSRFCPEVSYNTFGFFGSCLSQFADEIDQNTAREVLMLSGVVGAKDWRWNWQHVEATHYSSCPFYSLLQVSGSGKKRKSKNNEILQIRPTFWGVSVDLKKLFVVIKSWFW